MELSCFLFLLFHFFIIFGGEIKKWTVPRVDPEIRVSAAAVATATIIELTVWLSNTIRLNYDSFCCLFSLLEAANIGHWSWMLWRKQQDAAGDLRRWISKLINSEMH